MKSKLKIAFVLISFGATMLTVYAANQGTGGRPAVGVDVSRFSPQMLSISTRVAGSQAETAPVPQDTAAKRCDSLSIRNN